MALTLWKDLDDYIEDPIRYRRDLVPSWKRYDLSPNWRRQYRWRDDFGLFNNREWFDDFDRFHRDGIEYNTTKDGCEIRMDVAPFRSYEITVKTNNNWITVTGKREEHRGTSGYISRQLTRRYFLPLRYDANTVTSDLSWDGILTIKAQLPKTIRRF